MSDSSAPSCSSCGSWWRLPLLLALVLAALYLGRNLAPGESAPAAKKPPPAPIDAEPTQTVRAIINFGDGRRRTFPAIAWREGMTVRDALEAAGDRTGEFDFSHEGAGEAAFLTEIDGVANQGAGGRNWTYSVNGKRADRSFAIYELSPGDEVLWIFAAPQ